MITFLNVHRNRGSVAVKGPVTGFDYIITKDGTPISVLDETDLLRMTGPPCCGQPVPPFVEAVKLFGKHVPTQRQLDAVPAHLWGFGLTSEMDAVVEPEPPVKKPRRAKAKKPETIPVPEAETAEAEPVAEASEPALSFVSMLDSQTKQEEI